MVECSLVVAVVGLAVLARMRRRRRSVARLEVGRSAPVAFRRPGRRGRGSSLRRDGELAELADAVSRELRTGAVLPDALAGAAAAVEGSSSAELAEVLRSVAAGATLTVALVRWADAVRSPAVDAFVATATITFDLGGPGADAFEACADELRDREEVRDEVRSLVSQSTASAAMLTSLPPLAAAGFAALDPRTSAFLLGTGSGRAVSVSAVVLTSLGWWWMGRLVRGVV